MNKKLQEIIDWIPFIKQMIGTDAAICVWNKDAMLEAAFSSSEINVDFPKGYQVIDKSDKLYIALQTGKSQYNRIPKEVYGSAVEGSITPIFDGKEIIGAVTYTVSSEAKNNIVENANSLTGSMIKTGESIDDIKKGIESLVENMSKVQQITDLVKAQVEEATNVVTEIQRNANYSNILALNASIESARAGQAGRGFAVVSDEMGKFSKMSGEAAKKINKNLEEIVNSLNEVKLSIDHSTNIATEQSESVNELNKMFGEVTVTADKVIEVCKKLNSNLA